jgi:hypothetical protein
MTNKKGVGVFSGKEPLSGGKYSVMVQAERTQLFEILIDEQEFEMTCDTLDKVKNTSFKNSPTNSLYYDYIKFITLKKEEVAALNKQMESETDSEKIKAHTTRIQEVNQEVKDYQKNMMDKNKDNFAAQLVGMSVPLEVPPIPKDKNGDVLDSMFQYNWYVKHFFDHVPLHNPSIVRTPEFEKKLETFMTKTIMQIPDSMTRQADELLGKVEYDEELFKFCLHFITYNFEKSKIMGHDAGFVHMGEQYYQTGQATWLDSVGLAKVIDKAQRIKPLLIGAQAPGMYLRDVSGETRMSLYDVEADYTVIYIWDPDCGHCKKENPRVVEFQNKFAEHGVKVWAVGNPYQNEEWLEYL